MSTSPPAQSPGRGLWRAMLVVAAAYLAVQVWDAARVATDPPTLVAIDPPPTEAAEVAEPPALEPAIDEEVAEPSPSPPPPDPLSAEGPALAGEPYGRPLDTHPEREARPVTIDDPAPPEADDQGARLEEIRALLQRRAEQQQLERELADVHLLEGMAADEDIELSIDEVPPSSEPAGPIYDLQEDWDYPLRRVLAGALSLLLAALLLWAARRERAPMFGFIGALFLLSQADLLAELAPEGGPLWLTSLPTWQLMFVAFALLGLSAPRWSGRLFGAVVIVELASGAALSLESGNPESWAGWSTAAAYTCSLTLWLVAAWTFWERSRLRGDGARLDAGPYRSPAEPSGERPHRLSRRRAMIVVYGWLAAQLTGLVLVVVFEVEPTRVDGYVFIADLAASILLTLEMLRVGDEPDRASWRAVAAALWLTCALHLAMYVDRVVAAYGVGVALLPPKVGLVLLLVSAFGAGAALVFFVQALHATACARSTTEESAPPPPRPAPIFLLLIGGVALRLLAFGGPLMMGAGMGDELLYVVLGSSGFLVLSGVAFVRLTRPYAGPRADPLRWA